MGVLHILNIVVLFILSVIQDNRKQLSHFLLDNIV